ncbi:MAG: aminomethyltransferase family protein [Elusimicrobiota bacterium]
MPQKSPFHERTSALCKSFRWKEWAGYYAVCYYDMCHEPEYMAFRHAAGLLDVTPLFKYRLAGPDAAAFLSYVMTRDVRRLKLNQVTYVCWCDERGKILDDGTVARLGENAYRVTAAVPTFAWFERNSRGFDVEIEDVSDQLAVLALQGPRSRDILKNVVKDCDIDQLRFFRAAQAKLDGFEATITRTGYTGDLGYELWVPNKDALRLWDVLIDGGQPHRILPAGLDALDMTRVEAGFIMLDVDYFCAKDCMIESRKSTPFEVDLGWTVQLDREPFIGQEALKREREEGSKYAFVGLDIDWPALESLFDKVGLPPQLPHGAWRTPIPVYCDGDQIGQATSGTWSPTLKRNLALATVEAPYAEPGTELQIEVTVEFARKLTTATVVKKPFFDPERKRMKFA